MVTKAPDKDIAVIEKIGLPALVVDAGDNARYAWEEFIYGVIGNEHTRRAYLKAVTDLMEAADRKNLSLQQISPKFLRSHFESMKVSIPTKKLRLAAIRKFFNIAVTRHAIALNPSLSIRLERYETLEGKTPEISTAQAAKLLAVCDDKTLVGLRDKAIIAILIFTAARVGAVAKLKIEDFSTTGNQFTLKFSEKGGKQRSIPVRHDLEALIKSFVELRGVTDKGAPLFPSARKAGWLSEIAMHPTDLRRMLKRRLLQTGLSLDFSPHSFRVCTLTDLLKQGVPREDVQRLAGHADARTTDLYDRGSKKVTRNIVERISVRFS